jgi:hypothetical protein
VRYLLLVNACGQGPLTREESSCIVRRERLCPGLDRFPRLIVTTNGQLKVSGNEWQRARMLVILLVIGCSGIRAVDIREAEGTARMPGFFCGHLCMIPASCLC